MNIKQIIGLAVAIVGIALVTNSKFAMDATGETVRKKLTGEYTKSTRWQLYGGVVLALAGAVVLVTCRGKK